MLKAHRNSCLLFPTAGFIETANEFLLKYGLDRVSDLAEVTASVFVTVYELILGDRLEGKSSRHSQQSPKFSRILQY